MKIAIIGISFKLPNDVNSMDELYDVLSNKIDCVDEHPKDRFDINRYYDENNNLGKMRTKRGGYTNNIYDFDAEFFKISPKEAKSMDPQQRKMMELVYECMNDSKMKPNSFKNTKTGVFVGSCSMEYFNAESEDPENCNEYSITGGLLTLLSNRISYYFDLKGPSLTLDTACSSSGHALHLACQSINNGESEMCFVGGSNILLSPETFVGFSQATMLSPDGKCKTFDAKANGYVRGEGFVSLLLKPLEKAIQDNNKIYSVITSSGINQDGKTKSITMPNPEAQMTLLEELYQEVDLSKLLYVEAHGTGTSVGDFNETLAIGSILGKNKSDKLNIGSIKSNIGHLEAASGLASILKVCLMMQKKELLPNIHFEEPNPKIDFENLNLNVVDKKITFNQDKVYMGVNNFGFGGANFHCVLENYESSEEEYQSKNINKLNLLAIHGTSEESINNNIVNWLNYNDDDFMKFIYNQNKKQALDQTKIFLVKDRNDFENTVFNKIESNSLYTKFSQDKLNIAFVCCGQGPQHINMGYDMCQTFPVFREKIIECDKIWKKITGESFVEKNKMFLPEFREMDRSDVPVNQPPVAQPAIFFYQVALFELYKSYGIIPSAIIGHSAGELAAFHVSGAISLEDCVEFAYYRGLGQQKTNGLGNMLVINKSYQDLKDSLDNHDLLNKLEIACINDENTIVLAGSSQLIKEMNKKLDEMSIFNRIIRGNCPFHSSYQDIIKEEIIEHSNKMKFTNPNIKLISTVFGDEVNQNNYKSEYWWLNVREKVNFLDGINKLDNIDIFVELGPHPVLNNNIDNIFSDVEIFSSGNRKEFSPNIFMMTLANLWAAGNEINLEKFGNPNNTHYPKYVWNHKTYTNTPLQSYNRRHGINPKSNLIEFSVKKHAYITDHIIDSKFIFPTVGYFDIILRYFCNQNSLTLDDFQIKNMYIPENDYVQFKWDKKGNNLIFKSLDDKIEYINTQITTCKSEEEIVDQLDLNPEKYHYQMTGEECYNYFLKVKNFNFKDNMKSIENVLVRGDQCLIKLMNRDNNDFIVEPTFLDAGLLSAVIMSGITNNFTYLPIRCDQVKFYHLDKKPVWINSRIVENNLKKISIDVDFYDENFVKVASYTNYQASNVSNYDSDNNFRLEYKNLELINNNSSNMVHLYESDNFNLNLDVINDLETNISNLIYSNCENKSINQLKDDIILMDNNQNLKNIYFIINNNHNGLHQGFLRSYVNESTKNISIIQLSNNPKNDKKYIFDIAQENYEYNSEYYLQDENVKTIQVKPHQNSNFVCDKYYFNKNGKGLDSLRYFPLIDNVIEDYDVIVDVKASALNFKDLMVTLDVVPEDYIGYEAAGIVVKSNTKKYNVGDEVAIIKNKSGKAISNYVHCKNDEIFLKPKNLSFAEATTIGIVFSTVYICLIERARIQKGDTVLIHSATGGVGQSAIQICKMMGAEIIASAGNDDKRNKLKNQYGVKYVTNSRDPQDFKRDVLKFTDGKGVDVILNSLSGDSLRANFEIVKKGGIIVEIGKRDSIENNFINLQKFLDSITYSSVHFDRLSLSHPEYIEGIIKKVVSLFEEGALKPIEIEEFHISEAEKAIKHMAKGIHTGKIVLNVDDWKPKNLEPPQIVFNNKLYYLISGGLGGLGIELINWMNSHGANNFILTSRSGRTDTHAERIINILKNKGCDIVIAKVDTTDYDQLKYYFENNDYQIDGVFHLAGAIKDKYIKNLEESDINDVVDPKVKGCNNIYKVLEDQNLSYFVTFSSISALIGNPGQSAYCAANCYLDRFCHKLRSEGKHGLSINVGAIGGTGMIHRDYNLAKTMISNNFSFIHYQVLFNNLLEVLLDPNTSQICITNQDWNKMSGNYPKVSLLSDFKDEEKGENVEIDSNVKDQIIDYIKELLEIDNIDPNVNLTSYGIDSIMSMGLSNWFKDTLSFNISQLQILQGITINQILEKSCNLSITNNDGESGSKNKIKTFTRKSINLKTDEINNFLIELDDEEIVEKTSESNNSIFNLNIWTILFFSIFILFPIFFLISKA